MNDITRLSVFAKHFFFYNNSKIIQYTFIEVTNAEHIVNYKVSVQFNDGVTKTIDFYSMLFLHEYPAFMSLKDIEVFKNFKVTDTLEWENVNIDIAPETLYEMGEVVSTNPIEYSI